MSYSYERALRYSRYLNSLARNYPTSPFPTKFHTPADRERLGRIYRHALSQWARGIKVGASASLIGALSYGTMVTRPYYKPDTAHHLHDDGLTYPKTNPSDEQKSEGTSHSYRTGDYWRTRFGDLPPPRPIHNMIERPITNMFSQHIPPYIDTILTTRWVNHHLAVNDLGAYRSVRYQIVPNRLYNFSNLAASGNAPAESHGSAELFTLYSMAHVSKFMIDIHFTPFKSTASMCSYVAYVDNGWQTDGAILNTFPLPLTSESDLSDWASQPLAKHQIITIQPAITDGSSTHWKWTIDCEKQFGSLARENLVDVDSTSTNATRYYHFYFGMLDFQDVTAYGPAMDWTLVQHVRFYKRKANVHA